MNNLKVILGTVQIGLPYGINNTSGKVDEQQAKLILAEAFKAGIRVLDSAEGYGDAHHVIGRFHRQFPDQKFDVITKIPAKSSITNVQQKIGEYLRDLDVPRLEAIMFHSFASYKDNDEQCDQLMELKDSGLINRVGVSLYTNVEFEAVITDPRIELIQLPFNLLDNRSVRGSLIEKAKAEGKIIHTRSVFLQGLFFKRPDDPNPIAQSLRNALQGIHSISQEFNIPMVDLALAYCLSQQDIDGVLIGVDSVDQLRRNLQSVNIKLSDSVRRRISDIKIDDYNMLNPSLWK